MPLEIICRSTSLCRLWSLLLLGVLSERDPHFYDKGDRCLPFVPLFLLNLYHLLRLVYLHIEWSDISIFRFNIYLVFWITGYRRI